MPDGHSTTAAQRAGGNILRMLTNDASIFVLNFVTTVLLSRWLLPTGKGIYSLAILIPLAIAHIGNLGLPLGLTHHVGKRPQGAAALLGTSTAISVVLGVVYAGGFLLLDRTYPLQTFASIPGGVKTVALLGLPVVLWKHFASSILLGLDFQREFRRVRRVETIVLLVLVSLLVVGGHRGVAGAATAWLGSHFAAGMMSVWALRRAVPDRLRWDWPLLQASLRFGVQGWAGIVASFLLLRSDYFLVSHYCGAEALGLYSVSASLFMILITLPQSAFTSFLPQATQTAAGDAVRITAFTARAMTAACCLVAVGSVLPVQYLIVPIFGAPYAPAVRPLLILLPALAFMGAGAICNAGLQGMGHARYHSYSNGAGLILNIILNVLWIPRWGIAGAAAASTIAYICTSLVQIGSYAMISRQPILRLLLPDLADWRFMRTAFADRAARRRARRVADTSTPETSS